MTEEFFDLTTTIEKLTQPWNIDELDRDGVTDILQSLGNPNSGNAFHLYVHIFCIDSL